MSSLLRAARPRCATSHRSVRVVHTVLGGAAGIMWLVLPGMTINSDATVAHARAGPVTSTAAPQQDETSTTDLVLPLVAVGAAGVLAGYGFVRRTRRARTRTTPGGGPAAPPAPPPSDELDGRARELLVLADDCVRTSREELGFAEARSGAAAVAPFARAVREAVEELAVAFRMRQRYDDGVPGDATARRHAIAGIVGRCEEAGRRLDAEAAGFDRLRGLERGVGKALEVAEARFRELTGRTGSAESALAALDKRYGPSALTSVTGHVEQAKDRLVFATSHLNQAHQASDVGNSRAAASRLRAAEGAVAQAAVFVGAVDRLAAELTRAASLVPAALTEAEAALAEVREQVEGEAAASGGLPRVVGSADVPVGEMRARIAHAGLVLAAVREELTAGPYDPLDALRRIMRATAPVGWGRSGVLPATAVLVGRSATAATADFVTTHRGAVGSTARTRLAEAERLLATDPTAADTLARQARDLAEQDVRVHGNPYTGAADPAIGVAGAVLGGILLGEEPDGGPPASFGGPLTRARRRLTPS
ncbi:hypothetical protein ABZV31_29480 [Streptomyces sp. NPDC005202]|uniref:hypothetical protein n=1 Tax=Streptomyces sp. NPDC005202 TaxID=3157021 RepID=UPI0033A9B3CD